MPSPPGPPKVRPYICTKCNEPKLTKPGARGRLPHLCPDCAAPKRITLAEANQVAAKAATRNEQSRAEAVAKDPDSGPVEIVRNPFNSVPDRAPLPELPPGADIGPGLLTRSITAELATMRSTSPMAETLKASAILVAQAADAVPVEDLKQKLVAIKELRSIIDQLTKTAGGEDDGESDSPFGSSAPALVHQTAV